MKARDIMSTPAVTVSAGAPVSKVVKILNDRGFSALPVIDPTGNLLGVVSEADVIKNRFAAADAPLGGVNGAGHEGIGWTVGQVMSSPAAFVDQEASLGTIADTMLTGHRRSIPVVDDNKLVGVISRSDVMRCLAGRDAQLTLDIRRSLRTFGDSYRWSVDVTNGDATIIDDAIDRSDHTLVLAAVEAVPGVRHVTVSR